MRTLRITLPPPDKRLNAHNKGNRYDKAEAISDRRRHARILTKSAMNRESIAGKWKRASVKYEFYVPDNRHRDRVNMMQQEKPSIDGVVDAGLIVGDHWQVLEVGGCKVTVRKVKPGTVLIFEELEADE